MHGHEINILFPSVPLDTPHSSQKFVPQPTRRVRRLCKLSDGVAITTLQHHFARPQYLGFDRDQPSLRL
jgi:hypothetical protein